MITKEDKKLARKALNLEYDALVKPILMDILKNHPDHWNNFPVELYRMTPQWIDKLEGLGYDMEPIRDLAAKLNELRKVKCSSS